MNVLKLYKTKKYINKYAEKSVIFFSEGNLYYTTNFPVIEELIKKIDVLYITIDKNDKLLSFKHSKFHPIYISFGIVGQFIMATLTGKILITTTYSINTTQLRRSLKTKYYICLLHGCSDLHAARKYSFDYFDCIICIGEFQRIPLNILENKRKTKIKDKPVLGLPLYDIYKKEFTEKYRDTSLDDNEKYILIASSWGVNNFLNHIDYDIFDIIFKTGYNIIFRPHPMSFLEEPELIDNIVKKYINGGGNNLKFILDTEPTSFKSMGKSICAISSISGFMYDYILFAKKPILYFPLTNRNINELDECDLQDVQFWDISMLKKVGYQINTKEELKDSLLNINFSNYNASQIDQYINDIANFGCSSPYIAEYIINKFHDL